MIQGIIGKKIGMAQVFEEDATVVTVTVIEAGPCSVTQVKTVDKEGYDSVQLGFGKTKRFTSKKESLKEVEKFKHYREFEIDDTDSIEMGQKTDVSMFNAGDTVDITGVSKGKGFAGVVKRYGFAGGPKTHGQSDRHRAAGSIGAATSPGRVFKGMRMAGHMGNRRVTVQHLEIFKTDLERNLLLVKGAVPGGKNGLLLIKKSGREN
ncbi:MAG: 50S ribosomal protein L3 [Dehalococcoidales bacterium]|nr:50S ribosomal protein L3 [Dehalococcoidales bacterium]